MHILMKIWTHSFSALTQNIKTYCPWKLDRESCFLLYNLLSRNVCSHEIPCWLQAGNWDHGVLVSQRPGIAFWRVCCGLLCPIPEQGYTAPSDPECWCTPVVPALGSGSNWGPSQLVKTCLRTKQKRQTETLLTSFPTLIPVMWVWEPWLPLAQ